MNTAAPAQPGQWTEELAKSPRSHFIFLSDTALCFKLPVSLSLGLLVGFESGPFLSAQPWLEECSAFEPIWLWLSAASLWCCSSGFSTDQSIAGQHTAPDPEGWAPIPKPGSQDPSPYCSGMKTVQFYFENLSFLGLWDTTFSGLLTL